MKRLIPIALLFAIMAASPAKDKKAEERIAALEKQVEELQLGQASIAAGTKTAFYKMADIISDMAERENDLNERLEKVEKKTRGRVVLQTGAQNASH